MVDVPTAHRVYGFTAKPGAFVAGQRMTVTAHGASIEYIVSEVSIDGRSGDARVTLRPIEINYYAAYPDALGPLDSSSSSNTAISE